MLLMWGGGLLPVRHERIVLLVCFAHVVIAMVVTFWFTGCLEILRTTLLICGVPLIVLLKNAE